MCWTARTMSCVGQLGPCYVLDTEDHVMCWILRTMSCWILMTDDSVQLGSCHVLDSEDRIMLAPADDDVKWSVDCGL